MLNFFLWLERKRDVDDLSPFNSSPFLFPSHLPSLSPSAPSFFISWPFTQKLNYFVLILVMLYTVKSPQIYPHLYRFYTGIVIYLKSFETYFLFCMTSLYPVSLFKQLQWKKISIFNILISYCESTLLWK